MSEPFTDKCVYCGSPDVLDDAWWCEKGVCWQLYYADVEKERDYEERTPLTREKAWEDLMNTRAAVWGPSAITIEDAACAIARLAKAPVLLTSRA